MVSCKPEISVVTAVPYLRIQGKEGLRKPKAKSTVARSRSYCHLTFLRDAPTGKNRFVISAKNFYEFRIHRASHFQLRLQARFHLRVEANFYVPPAILLAFVSKLYFLPPFLLALVQLNCDQSMAQPLAEAS